MATLAQLRVSDPAGKVSFEILVTEARTMFNVHRVIQFCIKPRQADSHRYQGAIQRQLSL
jgi:hypothetical protein